jgi:hypothetical protein
MHVRHAFLLTLVACSAGCGSEDKAAAVGGGETGPTVVNPMPDPCSPAVPGCACDAPGKTMECKVYRKSGDYISCSTGTMTCGDTRKWGSCEGAAVVWDGG